MADNKQRTKKRIIEFVKKIGDVDPVPSASLPNAIRATTDSTFMMDEVEMNSRADEAGESLSLQPDLTGAEGGNASIKVNLVSTDGTTEPAILDALELCGMSQSENQRFTVADSSTLAEGEFVTGDISGATGVISVIDGDDVFVYQVQNGPFTAAEGLNAGTTTITAVSTNAEFTMIPDSENEEIGSLFYYIDKVRKAIKDGAGNFSWNVESSGLVKSSIDFKGAYDQDNWADAPKPDTTFLGNKPVVFKCSQMKMEWLTNESYIPSNTNVSGNLGAVVALLPNSVACNGLDGAYVVTRADQGGSAQIRHDLLANFDPDKLKRDNEVIRFSYRLGDGTVGRTIYIRQKVTIKNVGVTAVNDLAHHDLTFGGVDTNDADGELIIVFA